MSEPITGRKRVIMVSTTHLFVPSHGFGCASHVYAELAATCGFESASEMITPQYLNLYQQYLTLCRFGCLHCPTSQTQFSVIL